MSSILRKLIVTVALCLLATCAAQTPKPPAPPEQKRVQDVKFFSKSLQREMSYRVVLPHDYFSNEFRYPVLYLLHGLTGHYRSFEAHSNLTRYLDKYQLIAVSIEGENSWFINSAGDAKEKWEDYFLKDLIADVQERYRINGGDARAIAGISAGGYAAIRLALKYPGLFFFAGALSGSVTITRDPELEKALKNFGIEKIFGPPGSDSRKAADVFLLAEKPSRSAPRSSSWPAAPATIRFSATTSLPICCANATSLTR
jgi:S-formylglutathione hydrolase FrmB